MNASDCPCCINGNAGDVHLAACPVLVESLKAQAWDEGWRSGFALGISPGGDDGHAYSRYSKETNPYRRPQ